MPYLRDESQDVARAFGAKTTPDVFVRRRRRAAPLSRRAGRRLPGPERSTRSWLRDALNCLRASEDVARPETDPVGCSVKWKQ